MSSGIAFVRFMTEDAERLFDLLNGFTRSDDNLTFDMMSSTGEAVNFEGIISFIAKEPHIINFTAQPTGPAGIK